MGITFHMPHVFVEIHDHSLVPANLSLSFNILKVGILCCGVTSTSCISDHQTWVFDSLHKCCLRVEALFCESHIASILIDHVIVGFQVLQISSQVPPSFMHFILLMNISNYDINHFNCLFWLLSKLCDMSVVVSGG